MKSYASGNETTNAMRDNDHSICCDEGITADIHRDALVWILEIAVERHGFACIDAIIIGAVLYGATDHHIHETNSQKPGHHSIVSPR